MAQPGRSHDSAVMPASGTAHAATSPAAFQPPGSVKVSPMMKAPKKKADGAISPKPDRRSRIARLSGSGCLR